MEVEVRITHTEGDDLYFAWGYPKHVLKGGGEGSSVIITDSFRYLYD